MANGTPSFTGLKISNYYKYILYVAGVILIVSLFFEAKGISNEFLRHISFWAMIFGLIIWFFDSYIMPILEYFVDNSSDSDFWGGVTVVFFIAIQLILWFILYLMIENR
jgi:hypothetical protein